MRDLSGLENKLGYTFNDINLLKRALTHSSASREENYEQLEFLGDSVIQLIVTDKLYKEGGTEGEMTFMRQRMVSRRPLEVASDALGLTGYLEHSGGAGAKAVSSVYEAVVGAIYCDGGMDAAQKFVYSTLIALHTEAPENYKGELQEYTQSFGGKLPQYKTQMCGGEPHSPVFTCTVEVDGKKYVSKGKSKAEAEQRAARAALSEINRK